MPTNLLTKIKDFYQKSKSKSNQAFIIRGAASSFALKIVGTALAFVTQLFTARLLGAKGYGNYIYVMSFMEVMAIIGKFGFDTASTRFVSTYCGQKNWSLLRGFLRYSQQFVVVGSLMAAASLGVTAWLFRGSLEDGLLIVFWLASLMLPLFTSLKLQETRLLALKRVFAAQLPQNILRPLVILAGLGLAIFWKIDLTTARYMGLVLTATGIISLTSYVLWSRAIPVESKSIRPSFQSQEWWHVARATILFASLQVVLSQSDKLMIGTLVGTTDTGLYGVAKRISSLMAFPLIAVNSILGPMIARLYAQESKQELQRVVSFGVGIVMLITSAIAICLVVGGKTLLGLFGSEFTASYGLLMILVAGELINALSGPVALILNMTGHHNDTIKVLGLTVMLNLVLNWFLIPQLGASGAAIATAISLVLWNLLMGMLVWQRLKIIPLALPWLLRRNR